MERRGIGIYPSMPEGISKDIVNVILQSTEDAGAILQLIMADARVFRYERDNKELFWKAVLYRLFPEYVDAFTDIKGGEEYKNLVLWLSWGTRQILKKLAKLHIIAFVTIGNREFFPVEQNLTRIDVVRFGNWNVTRRTFAYMYGFHKGRLLALYAAAGWDLTASSFNSLQEYAEHKARQALYYSVESELSDVATKSNISGYDFIDLIILPSSDNKKESFEGRFTAPPKNEVGIITLGTCISCKVNEAQWQLKSDERKVYCSRKCFEK